MSKYILQKQVLDLLLFNEVDWIKKGMPSFEGMACLQKDLYKGLKELL